MPRKNFNYNFRSGQFSRGELDALYKEMARVANRRLYSLEKNERAFWAYDKATVHTQRAYGKNRFPGVYKGESDKGIIRELEYIQDFLQSKTSTITGSKSVENKILSTFERKGVDFSTVNQREFFNFLQSENFKRLSRKNIDSNRLIDYYTKMVENGKTTDVEKELEKFRKNEIKGVDELYKRSGLSFFGKRKGKNSRRANKK